MFRTFLQATIKSVAIAAASITVASVAVAQEPVVSSRRLPAASSRMTYPQTATAPLRWKANEASQGPGIRTVSKTVEPVSHAEPMLRSSIEFGEVSEGPGDQQVQPVQFTMRLDSPKNESETPSADPVRVADRESSRRMKEPARSVLSAPKPLVVPPAPRFAEETLVDPVEDAGVADSEESQEVQESQSLIQPHTEELPTAVQGPPIPEADPEDPMPTPPETLRQRPEPAGPYGRRPGMGTLPPKRRCSTPNERDCCAEDKVCTDQLDGIKRDMLKLQSLSRLDITIEYKPTPERDRSEKELRDMEEEKRRKLKLAGQREWRNMDGELLATGELLDLKLGRAIILTEEGEQVPLRLRHLATDELCFIAAYYNFPTECTLGNDKPVPREFIASTFTWRASALCHKPLYFEEVQVERYGHTSGPVFQPMISGVHFFANIALLPYKMGINPPNECQYALGYYRPGSCAPWMIQPFPLSARGAATAAGFYTGGAALIP